MPLYAVAFVCNALTGYFADKIPRHRGLIISGWLTITLCCTVATTIVTNFKARYVFLVFVTAGLWSNIALSLSFASSSFAKMSREMRAVSLFPDEDAPRYVMGFSVVSAMCAFGIGVYGILYVAARRGILDG